MTDIATPSGVQPAMSHPNPIKPAHKAIQTYYQTLRDYSEHHVGHETALRSAFQNLLADLAKTHHWLLVPEQSTRIGGIRSDPNRSNDPEYIVRLIGQVVRVSLETVRIVNALPSKFSP
jgi:hypothetical protein